jgi:hypothetical protein
MNKTITMVIIDTENKILANHALTHSSRHFQTSKVLALTDSSDAFEGYEKILIDKIQTLEDYNNIVLNYLPQIIDTDYVLIIQFDGFVINPNLFSELYLNFDYIGASWPQFGTSTVGNGGFSMRSLKLLKAAKEISHLRKNNMAEDEFICRYIRPILEYDYGIKFAPSELADFFSKENKIIDNPTFGFHGFHHLVNIYSRQTDFFLGNLSPRFFKDRYYQILVSKFGSRVVNRYINNGTGHQ